MRLFYILIVLGAIIGCKPVAVRDSEMYKMEVDFIDAATEEMIENGKGLISEKCTCSDRKIVGVDEFDSSECRSLAETIVVIEARMKYHTDLMRYLWGLSDARPPKEVPDIPDVGSLCGLTR